MTEQRDGNPTGRRETSFAFALVLVVLAVALVAAELIARFLGAVPFSTMTSGRHRWAQEDDVLGWANKPGTFLSHEDGKTPMTFWDGGRRATRREVLPSPQVQKQVVLIGASFTQGYSVRDDQTFAWQIDAALPHASVENYGTGGYGTYQSLLLLERLFETGRIEPDLVVYGFPYFTSGRNVAPYEWQVALRLVGPQRYSPPHVVLENSRLEFRPASALTNWPLEHRLAAVRAFHDSYNQWSLGDRNAMVVPATLQLLSRMRDMVERAGSRLLVAVLDGSGETDEYGRFMKQNGIPYVDCTYPESVLSTPRLKIGGVGHPNQIPHAYWAACIGERIEFELRRIESG